MPTAAHLADPRLAGALGKARDLALQPGAPAFDRRLALTRSLQDEVERPERLFDVVLVQLGELEPDSGIVELGAQRFEIGERPSAIPRALAISPRTRSALGPTPRSTAA